jgi:hypothetical protein
MDKVQKPINSEWYTEDIREQGAEENIGTEEGWSDRRLEKAT